MEGIALRTSNPNHAIALKGLRLRATLAGMSLKAVLEQTFVNAENTAIEAVYTFPLADGAAVCGFEVVTGDRVLTGAIDEIDKAQQRYDDAVADGHGAFLAEQHRPDVFSVRVGNLKPQQAATIKLTYVRPLDLVDKSIRIAFPTTIAPRYTTATGTDPLDAAIDGETLNPPHVLSVPYGLSMEVDVALGLPLADITSPTHAVKVDRIDDVIARVTLANPSGVTEMNRDLVLAISLRDEHTPAVAAADDGAGNTYLNVTFIPEFDVDDLTKPHVSETVFVLDCSGSMGGQSIEQARTALALCLRSLSEGDTFNICRFGSAFELMSPEPLVYSQQTLDAALAYVEQTSANLGGTEILQPLEAVLSGRPAVGQVRQVIVLTDGQVTNEPAVLALAHRRRSHNRIFAFGIGTASSSFLVNGLARATGGAAEFITGNERIEDKVMRTFGRIASPPVTDVEIDWGNSEVVQAPAVMPPLFDGDALSVFGRITGKLPAAVTLKCNTPTGLRQWIMPVGRPQGDATILPTLWARRMMQEIEETHEIRSPYRQAAGESWDEKKLVMLSKQFNLLCKLTTFIAIEHRSPEERNDGKPALRRVPVMLAEGHGLLEELSSSLAPPAQRMPAMAMRRMSPAPLPATPPMAGRGGSGFAKRRGFGASIRALLSKPAVGEPPGTGLSALAEESVAAEADRGRGGRHHDPLQSLLSAQRADGSFDDVPAIQETLGADAGAVWSAARSAVGTTHPAHLADLVARTAIIVGLLRDRFSTQQPTWRRAEQKALRYLAKALKKDSAAVEALLAPLVQALKHP